MKKIYVMAAFLGASSFAFNQVVSESAVMKVDKTVTAANKMISPIGDNNKAIGVELWSDDFDTTQTINWVIAHDPATQGDFVIGDAEGQVNAATQAHPGYYQLLNSPTQDNGIAYFDGIQYLILPPPGPNVQIQNAWIEMSNSVNLAAYENVTLQFAQGYRAFNTDVTYVEVSLDGGTTWEQAVDVNDGVAFGNYGDATVRENFFVDNSATVKFRFRWSSPEAHDDYGSGYAWQIDDVSINSLPDNDIQLNNYIVGATPPAGDPIFDPYDFIEYHQIPLTQVIPIGGAAMVKSKGEAQQTGVKVTADEATSGYSDASAGATLNYGDKDTLYIENPFTPTANGDYSISYDMVADDVDDVPGNNQMPDAYEFTVTDNIYARDDAEDPTDGTFSGSIISSTIALASTNEVAKVVEPGNWYRIVNTVDAVGIDFQFGDSITVGAQVFGNVYEVKVDLDGQTLLRNFLFQTTPYEIQAGDEAQFIQMDFSSAVTLDPGIYAVSVVCLDEDGFSVATSGKVNVPGTSFIYAPGISSKPWFGAGDAPVVRLRLDETLNVNNDELAKLNVTQYPNPFANETTVSFSLEEASNVSYTITDMTGKVIANVNKGNLTTGNHEITVDGSSFANGIYYFNLKTDNAQVTRKLVVNK